MRGKRSLVFFILQIACSLSFLHAVTPTDFELNEVEVIGSMTGVQGYHRTDSSQVIERITQSDLAHLPIANISDVLAYLPNIDVRSRGASGAQTDISMRGGTFDQVAVLLNGMPIQDAQTGHYAMNIPISTAMIECIEVLQGEDITGALTGAINIVTKHTWKDEYTLMMKAGTNSLVSPAFAGSWKRGDVHINTSVDYHRSDGYYAPTENTKEQEALRNTDFQTANLYFQTRWKGLDVQVGSQYKDAGLGTGYGYASTDQFDATRTLFTGVQYHHRLNDWLLRSMVSYRGQYDRYEWHRGTATNRHWTHNTQAALYADYYWRLSGWISTFGAEGKNEMIRSTNMGEHNRWQVTMRARQQFSWVAAGRWTASLSGAAHYNSWCGWYGSGVAHINYQFDQTRGNVYLNANRSLRMPTWTDMYYKAGVQRGSTDLKAEKAWQLSAGIQYNFRWKNAGQLHLQGDVYYRWGEDIIDWTFDETDSLFHATNRNKVNTFGVELNMQYHYNEWLRNVALRYAYTQLSLDLTTAKSNYLDYLRHKVTLQIDHGIYVWSKGCVGANWSLRWQDRMGTYVDIYGKAGNAFEPVLLLDGSIYMELAHVRVNLECTNMTNRHYYDYGGVLMPGVQGCIGITAHL